MVAKKCLLDLFPKCYLHFSEMICSKFKKSCKKDKSLSQTKNASLVMHHWV